MMKTLVKSAIGLASPRLPLVRDALEGGLTVFLSHDVAQHPSPFSRECGLAVDPASFERQVRWIAQEFQVISLDALLAGHLPPRAALITFDDGFASVFRTALPILRRHGLPSTIFLNMASVLGEPFWGARAVYLCRHVEGFLEFLAQRAAPSSGAAFRGHPDGGRSTRTAARLEAHLHCSPEVVAAWEARCGHQYLAALSDYTCPFATADDLAAVQDDPLVAFGSHAYHHYSLRVLPDAAVRESLQANAEALRPYRNSRPVFAFPFGVSATGQSELVSALGYERIFTSLPRVNPDPAAGVLHRIPLTAWHDRRSRLWFQVARAALDMRHDRL